MYNENLVDGDSVRPSKSKASGACACDVVRLLAQSKVLCDTSRVGLQPSILFLLALCIWLSGSMVDAIHHLFLAHQTWIIVFPSLVGGLAHASGSPNAKRP